MKELRIIFATICLLYIAGLSFTVSAKEEENEGHHTIQMSGIHIDDDDESDDDFISAQRKSWLEAIREKNKKRIEKLRKKSKNKKSSSTHSGSTINTGTKTQTGTVSPKPTPTTTTPAPVATATAVTKTQTVAYGTPEGSVSVGFSATVKGGIITAASSTTKASGSSGYYQNTFAQGLAKAVVGKKAAGLNLAAIGGASLTTTAFEKFIAASF